MWNRIPKVHLHATVFTAIGLGNYCKTLLEGRRVIIIPSAQRAIKIKEGKISYPFTSVGLSLLQTKCPPPENGSATTLPYNSELVAT